MAGKLEDYIFDYLTTWSQNVTDEIRSNLVSKDAWFDQSTLAQSIQALPVEVTTDGYIIRIEMNDYGHFVDKGRKPTKQGTRSTGISVQRRLTGGDGWIARRRLPVPLQIEIKKNGKSYIRKFKNINDANRSLSFAISKKIHKDGYISKGYGFYSEVVNDSLLAELSDKLIPLLGEQIEVVLKDIE